jgi:hypothetical protein
MYYGAEFWGLLPINRIRLIMRATRLLTAVLVTLALFVQPLLAQSSQDVRLTGGASQNVYTNSVATIRGTALTATNNPLVNARVRLRNARTGRIVGFTTTDHAGLFEFHNIEPGSYIVELVSSKDEVLAASDLLNPNGGDIVSTIVKLPFDLPVAGGVLGHMNAAALILTATAAAAGVLATVPTGQAVSPRR